MNNIIAIGNKIGSSSFSWAAYWDSRYPSGLVANTYSDTEIDLSWTNNGVADYTGHKVYVSTDNITFTLNATLTSIVNYYRVQGLTSNTPYYLKVIPYKGSHNGTASNVVTDTTVLFADNFPGIAINSDKWTETDGGSLISQSEGIVLTLAHASNINEFVNTLVSKSSIASGVAVGQAYLTWITNTAADAMGGIYLYKDANNFAAITSRATAAGDKYRLRIYTGGVSRYDLNTTAVITKGKHVKIWTDGTTIKFYYWDTTTTAWVQMGTTQTFSLGYPLYYTISAVDNTAFTGANPVLIKNAILSTFEYTKLYSDERQRILDNIGYCWFNSPKPTYNATANKTWFTIAHKSDGAEFTQHVMTLDHTNKSVSIVKLGAVVEMDDHDEGSILVRASDGKLFTAYTEHARATSPLRHRISTNARDASAWGAAANNDPDNPNLYTYANAFEVVNGDIYIFYRSSLAVPASNTWRYIKSTDGGATFGASTTIFNYSISPYVRIFQSATNKDLIHFIGCPHPVLALATTSVVHFYFNAATGTYHKSDGTDITANLPIDNSDATVVVSKDDPEQLWIEDLILDSSGNPRILFTYYSDFTDHPDLKYLYYTEWTGTAWTTPYLLHQSCHKNIASTNPSSEDSYMPLACFDRGNPDRIFASKEITVGGLLELYLLTRVNYNSFTSVRKTYGTRDQWRPITTNASTYNVFWIDKTSYVSYSSFSQRLLVETF